MNASDRRRRVLIVEDDESGLAKLTAVLTSRDFEVYAAPNGEAAFAAVSAHDPDIVLLNPVLPDGSADGLLATIARKSQTLVLLMVDQFNERGQLLQDAVADVISKPIDEDELLSRIEALLGAGVDSDYGKSHVVHIGSTELDIKARRASRSGQPLALSATEWALLDQLFRRPGEPVFDQELLVKVWGAEYRNDTDFLALWMARLGHKLGDLSGSPSIQRFANVAYMLAGVSQAEQ